MTWVELRKKAAKSKGWSRVKHFAGVLSRKVQNLQKKYEGQNGRPTQDGSWNDLDFSLLSVHFETFFSAKPSKE